MNVLQKMAVNSGILLANNIVIGFFYIAVSILLIRYLGAEGYGKYSIVFAYLSFVQALLSFGIDTIINRETARKATNQNLLVGNAIMLNVFLSIIAVGMSWTAVQFIGYSDEIKLLIYMASLSVFFSFGSIYVAVFRAHLKVNLYAIPEVIIRFVFLGIIILLIILKFSIFYFVLLSILLSASNTLMYIFFSKKIEGFKPQYKVDYTILKFILGSSLPLFIMSVFIAVNHRIDQILIFNMLGSKSLGLYSAAVNLTEAWNIIPVAFVASTFPLCSLYFAESKDKFTKLYIKSFQYMSIIIIPVAFGTALLSKRIIGLIYGNAFLDASGALSVLIWSEIFVFLSSIYGNAVIAAGLQKKLIFFPIIGGMLNILLNLILIPRYGIVGAAIASFISYGGSPLLLLQWYYIKEARQIGIEYFKSTVKPLLCALPMAVFIYTFSSFNLFVLICMSGFIYSFFLIITKCIGSEDFQYAAQIIQLKKIKIAGVR